MKNFFIALGIVFFPALIGLLMFLIYKE